MSAGSPRRAHHERRIQAEIVYLDSSALVKLVVEEAESRALDQRLAAGGPGRLTSSSLALLEVSRAVRLRTDSMESVAAWHRVARSVRLVEIDHGLLHRAAAIASRSIRSLDAIHLASALRVEPDVLITYDERMAAGARELALPVEQPGLVA